MPWIQRRCHTVAPPIDQCHSGLWHPIGSSLLSRRCTRCHGDLSEIRQTVGTFDGESSVADGSGSPPPYFYPWFQTTIIPMQCQYGRIFWLDENNLCSKSINNNNNIWKNIYLCFIYLKFLSFIILDFIVAEENPINAKIVKYKMRWCGFECCPKYNRFDC